MPQELSARIAPFSPRLQGLCTFGLTEPSTPAWTTGVGANCVVATTMEAVAKHRDFSQPMVEPALFLKPSVSDTLGAPPISNVRRHA